MMKELIMETTRSIKLLTMDDVAEMLQKSRAQMAWLRHQGTGPKSAKLGGRVMYREQDVIDWVNAAFDGASK